MEMNFLTLYLLPLIVGWVLDLVFGDPEKLPHPVVLFGKLIAKGERLLNRGSWRRMKGALLAIGLVAATIAATWALLQLADAIYIIGVAVRAILVFYCLAGTTLIKEVRDVFLALDRSLDEGRRQVARIVGRDTSELSREEVQKAALETLAEHTRLDDCLPLATLSAFRNSGGKNGRCGKLSASPNNGIAHDIGGLPPAADRLRGEIRSLPRQSQQRMAGGSPCGHSRLPLWRTAQVFWRDV